jgi:TrmH family RNA methyltransferase
VLVAEGSLLLAEAMAAGWPIEGVYVEEGGAVPATVLAARVPVHELAPGVLAKVASTEQPQPLLAVVRRRVVTLDDLGPVTFVVALAGIADPGNAGTILRSAEAAGADAVVLTTGSVDVTNPKVVRASAGAVFHVPTVEGVPVSALANLGLPRWGASATGGVPYTEAPLDQPVVLVLGNEAHGLPLDLDLDGVVSIPHAGRAESLNVAMAATLLCFEVARQRRTRPDRPHGRG